FHPTAIDVGLDPAPLATEALRGEGAVLIDTKGQRFMERVHAMADLAPRDIVARAVHAQRESGQGAFLDCREAIGAAFEKEFPKVYASCQAAGLDPATQPIPIATAAHYHMGGVMTDVNGRTSLDGLWACGEVACTGAHGANRLASNSLLEAVVFAGRTAQDIDGMFPHHRIGLWRDPETMPAAAPLDNENVAALRQVMTRDVGVIRSAESLTRALGEIDVIERAGVSRRLRNMVVAARIVTWAALRREESRGGHYRSDHPEPREGLAQRTYMTLSDIGESAAQAA
ncbi:MAG: FAD-binding protein, partial [Pseudomonadota bacterium]